MTRLRPIAIVAAGATALWLVIGHGFANYDALYSLLWGRELAHGEAPQVDVPLAPTPHPLSNLVGAVLSAFPAHTGEDILVAIAYLSLATVAYLVFCLGREWFGWAAGLAAAAVLLTREPVISYGIRAYVDVPYLALVLGALLVEVRRPRAGVPVLALLGLAGLLRPEAWLFAGAYVLWIWRARRPTPAELALVVAAPVLWLLYGAVAGGGALESLHSTRDAAQTLERATGIDDVPITIPRRIGEVLQIPGLVGAAAGLAFGWRLRRERIWLAIGALVLAAVAFAVLATAGLPIIARYAFLIAAIAAVLCGGALLGWLELGDRDERRRWAAAAAVVLAVFVVFAPQQARKLDRTRDALAAQQSIRNDLYALLDEHPIPGDRVAVANHRLVPLVALATGREPRDVVTDADGARYYIGPATTTVARRFILDPRDPVPRIPQPPAGAAVVARNASWVLYSNQTRAS
ncbi:MAG TPA: hypothetical protein VFB41_09120 [Solirubrobacteraceae bacterium]|nr:hypothetical protein [Solirubrobacteraceae bacterium]